MKKSIVNSLCFCVLIQAGLASLDTKSSRFDLTGPRDSSLIRGFNYTPANVASPRHHIDHWIYYDSATTVFDLNLAKSLSLNQIFVPYAVYTEDKEALPAKLRHFVRECHKRGIGIMPVVGSGPWMKDTSLRAQGREWVQFLVNAISDGSGLAFWDVMNEPDWSSTPRERVLRNFENCKFMAKTFHELDPNTPLRSQWLSSMG